MDVQADLQALGYEVECICLMNRRGMGDLDVYDLARRSSALLVTRDRDFTNSLRFPPNVLPAILYLMDGNLKGADEAQVVRQFLQSHSMDTFQGKLVFLSPNTIRIR